MKERMTKKTFSLSQEDGLYGSKQILLLYMKERLDKDYQNSLLLFIIKFLFLKQRKILISSFKILKFIFKRLQNCLKTIDYWLLDIRDVERRHKLI